MFRRREVLQLPAAALLSAGHAGDDLQSAFLTILRGFFNACAQTSNSLTVCEFPDATVTSGFRARSGLSVTAVTRMLPLLAAWALSGRNPQRFAIGKRQFTTVDVIYQICHCAFDPKHPDYWQPADPAKSDQRQVEGSIVAWSIWLLRDVLLPMCTSEERRRMQNWLASCTQHPVRNNNWAWFTAVNQVVRLSLSRKYPEFQGDEPSMLADLAALDGMARGEDGWYSDSVTEPMFDYYNSWVFASHFLYWNRIAGTHYPDWSKRFGERLKKYLATAPLFFGPSGSHVLYGRSLIYRFGVVTPLVLAYQQGLWPHSPGLLRTLFEANLGYFWRIGGFDAARGKLRETFSAEGAAAIREPYIDGGHPYWGMQAFAAFLIPARDPFWRRSQPQPIEHLNARAIPSAGLLITRDAASGDVQLYNALSTRLDPHYRDKYNKLVYSTANPFCIVPDATLCPWDSALVLRDRNTGSTAGRGAIETATVSSGGVEYSYTLKLGQASAAVRTRIQNGRHEHTVRASGASDHYELVEGSAAYPDAQAKINASEKSGWVTEDVVSDFGQPATANSHIVWPRFQVTSLRAPLRDATLAVRWRKPGG